MVTFVKAQAASLAASVIDFFTTVILVEVFGCWHLPASITGTIIGGFSNFTIGRVWVFNATGKKIPVQVAKYSIVWVGNLVLNGFGFFIVTHYFHVNYIISKILVSVIIGFGYNYMLQKKFVFK